MSKKRTLEKKKIANDKILSSHPANEEILLDQKRLQLAIDICEVLRKRNWNYLRLANEMDRRPSEISKWLSGEHNFTIDTLFKIESILGITIVSAKRIAPVNVFPIAERKEHGQSSLHAQLPKKFFDTSLAQYQNEAREVVPAGPTREWQVKSSHHYLHGPTANLTNMKDLETIRYGQPEN